MQKLLEKLQMVNPDFSGAKCEDSYSKLYDKKIYRKGDKGRGYALHEEISVNDKELIISLHIGEKYHNIFSQNDQNKWILDACCVQGYTPIPHPDNPSEYIYNYKYKILKYDDNNSLKVAEATALIQYFHRIIGKPILDSLCSIDILDCY
ncbi:MAG: hypothetical protein SOZ83_01225 [Sphaerochaetaceae bacterium]|nr:hypothetical protein [Sphaerochaetaceae bacterium]